MVSATITSTGSKILDILNQIVMDHYLDRVDESELINRLSERFKYEGYYVIDPLVEVKLKGYITKDQIYKVSEIVKHFAGQEEWTVAQLRAKVREIEVHIDC